MQDMVKGQSETDWTQGLESLSIEELATLLADWEIAYRNGEPKVSDHIFNLYERRLKELAPRHPVLIHQSEGDQFGVEVPLVMPMGSLANSMTVEEALEWQAKTVKDPNEELWLSAKVDGLSIELCYDDQGRFIRAATKGNGLIGTDVTETVKLVPGIPHTLPVQGSKVEIRGELHLPRANLVELQTQFTDSGKRPYKNCRASACAIVRFESLRQYAVYLRFAAFDASFSKDEGDFRKVFSTLVEMGFSVPVCGSVAASALSSALESLSAKREQFPYDADGIVVSVMDRKRFFDLGVASEKMMPRGATAFKFEGDSAEVEVRDIYWSAEGSEYLSPVALIDPVELDGALVSRVSLKSLEWMETYKVGVGALVKVIRAGSTIPAIPTDTKTGAPLDGVIVRHSTEYLTPKTCPCCGSEVVRDLVAGGTKLGARIRCVNENCEGKVATKIVKFLYALGVKGAAHVTALEWVQGGGMSLLDMVKGASNGWDGLAIKVGKGSVNIWAKIVDQARERYEATNWTFAQFLSALSIKGVTEQTGEAFANVGISSPIQLVTASAEFLSEARYASDAKIGARAEPMVADIQRNQELIFLASLYVKAPIEKEAPELKLLVDLTGLKVCMTGDGPADRTILQDILRAGGAIPASGVSGKTNLLILEDPESTTTKARTAREKGIKIMAYKDVFGPA